MNFVLSAEHVSGLSSRPEPLADTVRAGHREGVARTLMCVDEDEVIHSEPEQAQPWNPANGPQPVVFAWPPGARPALWVLIDDQWVYAPVRGRYKDVDGGTVLFLDVILPGEFSARHRAYRWPQPDRLRTAHGSPTIPTSCDGPYDGAETPTGPHVSRPPEASPGTVAER
ncbi:hypothetical protein [Streptomyces noursei]|uniref:hypothetical protein n=1 Tax=Streptomyces noursei TaxID=1971 RepID=UPI0023B7773F|nr:hypothetical protein [Streptomyces noursei]